MTTSSRPVNSSLAVSPTTATLTEGAAQTFTSSAAANWSATCGSISGSGVTSASYIAPLAAGSCTVSATATSGGSVASAAVTVTSPLTITPSSASTPQNGTQQFTANMAVAWSSSCGSISTSGLFTASSNSGSNCTITARATSGTAYTATASDKIGTAASFTISPTSATLSEGATQTFTASAVANWSSSCGSVSGSGSTSGAYTAPLTAGACTVTATPATGGAASAAVSVTSPITITPSSASTSQNATQQFTANMAVNWSSSCGVISTAGLFTASGSPGACTITATAASGAAYTATASDLIISAILNVSPANPALSEGAQQQFSSGAPANWSASCGTISSSGLYTAPLTPGSCTITATATDGSNQTASTAATIASPITITPASALVHAIGTQAFTASQSVTWSASCGSIDPNAGTYTAPNTAGNCTITATAASGAAYTAQATANVDVVNYTAWKGGGGGTGAQTDETALTPASVSSSSFGLAWTASVDGWANAQPLYMNGLVVNGAPHNVVFVETANDSVYAFDGDTGAQLWQVSLIPSGATAVVSSTVGFTSTSQIGILGTPAIDPATNTMYVVAETSEQSGTYFPHRLHALDLATGNEKFGGPVLVDNPDMAPMHKLQRPGLLLANGNVYVGIGSMQDMQPYHGLLFAFDAHTLAQQAVWVVTPSGSEGGIWMGGAAPAVDSNGDIYVNTGNGTFDGATNFGESAAKLSPGLQLLDYFTPYNYADYDSMDIDLGSGSVLVVPDQSGQHTHELIVCGKPTPIYVLDRDNMGHVGTTSDNVIQRLDNVVGRLGPNTSIMYACYTSPAMWNQNVYFGGKWDVLKMFTLDSSTGLLSSSPVSQDTQAYGYPGAEPVVSAQGNSNGIVWAIDTGTSTLRAVDATNVATLLYSGTLSGGAIRWTVPTVVNGHVYVAEQGKVFGFGLK